MQSTFKKVKCTLFLAIIVSSLLSNLSYANTYSNNSIEIEVSPQRRSYDYGDNVAIDINITNKNRYANLYYKISEIYSGGGFIPLNLDNSERVIASMSDIEINVALKDRYYKETEDKEIDTHIRFNNNYYNSKGRMSIGSHAYELTEKEYEEFTRYRNEKVVGEKLGTSPNEKSEQEQLDHIKSQINAILLIIVIVLIIVIALIVFIWFIIKSRSKGGYPSLSRFNFLIILFTTTLFINILFNKKRIYASDIYQENVLYNKTVSTQVNYANFTCTFDVKIEYYFVNTITPITDLELDTDSDTLPDYLEVLYLTDLYNDDTDGDGLPDGVEVYRTYTDPLRVDTDNNGINDSDEDYDKDKLTNIEEKNYGTDYDNIDTDFDSLSDYDEINGVKSKDGTRTYILDPLSDDTDGDGLRDDTEIKIGLNPTYASDAHTKVSQTSSEEAIPRELGKDSSIPISFYGELAGDIDENVRVRKSNNNFFDNMQGLVGNPISIDTTYGGSDGLKISFDLAKYSSVKDRVQLCRYVDGELIPVEHTYVSGDKLLGDVYTGEYVLVDSKKYTNSLKIYIK